MIRLINVREPQQWDRVPETYEGCLLLARELLCHARADMAQKNGMPDARKAELLNLARSAFRENSRGPLRKRFTSRSPLGNALVELFLYSRTRGYGLAFLGIQECLPVERDGGRGSHIMDVFAEVLSALGRMPLLTAKLGGFKYSPSIDLDPLGTLRRAYHGELMRARRPRGSARRSGVTFGPTRTVFLLKVRLIELIAKRAFRFPSEFPTAEDLTKSMETRNAQRVVVAQVLILFPGSSSLGDHELVTLGKRIGVYLAERFADLLRVMTRDSLEAEGVAKLAKTAVGVISWRVRCQPSDLTDHASFIFDTIRLAYCWGTTYPLIDDVLDSPETESGVLEDLRLSLEELFEDGPPGVVSSSVPLVDEVCGRLSELLSLIDPESVVDVKRTLRHLLQAHLEDSGFLETDLTNEDLLLSNSMVRAALVRFATKQISGASPSDFQVRHEFSVGLLNQLSDDVWDFVADREANRATPITALASGPGGIEEAIRLYLDYGFWLIRECSQREQVAATIGMVSATQAGLKDVSGGEEILSGILRGYGIDDGIGAAPFVDPDPVIFGLFAAIGFGSV